MIDFVTQYINKKNIEILNKYNKCKLIDYLLLIKLIMEERNIYFSNLFYIEIVSYLKPHILPIYNSIINNNQYNYSDLANNIISKYNIDYSLFGYKIFMKNKPYSLYVNKDMYIDIYIKKKITNDITIFDIKIHFNLYSFNINVIGKIDFFHYEIPVISYKNIKYNTFDNFNNDMIDIWSDNFAIFMWDYFTCINDKKIIYYELFKKIIIRLL